MNRTSLSSGLLFSALVAVLPSCGDGNEKCKDGSNSDNCGVCETACLQGETCIDGACVTTCFAPSKQCGATCDNLQTSVANCGTCGNACAPYGECTAGKCENPLAALQTELFAPPIQGQGDLDRDRDLFMLEDGSLELIKVNGPLFASGAGVIDHAILPNGDVLMVAAQDTAGARELYRVSPRGGTRTKLSPALPEGGQVEPGLAFSADGTKVLFRANLDTDDGDIDLYAVELAKPGVAVKINGEGEALAGMAISADGKRAAYIGEYNDGKSFRQNAFTVDLSAAQPGEPQELGEGIEDIDDLQLSENGKRIVFRTFNNGDSLYAVDTATPSDAHRLDNTDGGEGGVSGYQLAADGSGVVFAAPRLFDERSLWRAPLEGATAYQAVELVDGEELGSVQRDLRLSPDGKLVYFRKLDPNGELLRLYRTDATTPAALTLLSDAGDSFAVAVADFALSRDGKSMAYRANLPAPEVRAKGGKAAGQLPDDGALSELRFVDLSQATPAASILLTPAVPEGHDGIGGGFLVTDDRRVLFPGDFDEQAVRDIYIVAAGTPGTLRKVSPPRPQTSEAAIVSAVSLFPR